MGARLAAAEASLRETISTLDVGLRVHAQEAVAQAQLAVAGLSEKVHFFETVRGRSNDVPVSPPFRLRRPLGDHGAHGR